MHDHDLDLIAEYASGFLTGADESRAAEFVRSCDQCASEFEDQGNIRALLEAVPVPALSEFERTSLRRSVLDTVSPPRRTRIAWQRRVLAVTGVAAAVLVAAVGVGVVGQLASDDDAVTVADGGESFATTTAAAEMRVPPADSDDAAGADEGISALAADEEGDALDDSAATESTASTPNLLIDAGEVASQDQLDSLLAELTGLVAETSDIVVVEDAVSFGASCAIDVEGELLAVVVAMVEGSPVQVFLTGDRSEPSPTFLSGQDCTPLSS